MNTPSFGLIARLANSRITLPLIHIETRFRVTSEIAVVEIDQVFEQNARESLDVTYTFPLPDGAAVYRCEMIVNGRVIRAVVMEERKARQIVTEKRAEGHRTALVEMDRDNLFTLQLGNTAPSDRIVIRFAYFELLNRIGTQLRLRIPFCPSIHYIPGTPLLRKNCGLGWQDDTNQVPDASRLSPPRISGDHPDAATLFLHGSLDESEVNLSALSSPTHPAILRIEAGRIEVELAGEQHLPDRAFVLCWEEPAAAEPQPKAWVSEHADASGNHQRYALLQLRAPQAEAVTVRDDFAQDVYFLLDRSGSMAGEKWEKSAEALHAFARELSPSDRVWITCFESDFQDFAEAPLRRDDILADASFQTLSRLGTAGGTELLPALGHVLKMCALHSASRPARLILITDGQVGNESEILRLIMHQPDRTLLPIHTFGIDTAVNDAFLKNLAHLTSGRCALLNPDDDIPTSVKKLAVTLRHPVLTHVRLQENHHTPSESPELPDLHPGEVLLLPLRLNASHAETTSITALLPDGRPWSVTFDLSQRVPDAENPAPRLLWVRRHCDLLNEPSRKTEAIQLAITHNILCRGASFVAWDAAERVTIAKREVYQPSMAVAKRAVKKAAAKKYPVKKAMAKAPMLSKKVARYSRSKNNTANFFEEKINDYLKPCTLRECSDEDLVSDTSVARLPQPVRELLEELRTAYGSANIHAFDVGTSSASPRSLVRLLAKFFPGITTASNNTPIRLAIWATSFSEKLITKLNLPKPIADQIVIILCAWSAQNSHALRIKLLETWLNKLGTNESPVEHFKSYLKLHSKYTHIQDALKLITCFYTR